MSDRIYHGRVVEPHGHEIEFDRPVHAGETMVVEQRITNSNVPLDSITWYCEVMVDGCVLARSQPGQWGGGQLWRFRFDPMMLAAQMYGLRYVARVGATLIPVTFQKAR